MKQDEIIEMALLAGLEQDGEMWFSNTYKTDMDVHINHLEAFAKLVAAKERENTNNAYKERNQLVALLSTLFPSGKAKTAIDGWDESWHGCVYIDFPWGQASWHYHIDDEWMFEHLSPYTKAWDGHTTEAKYAYIAMNVRARGET